MPARSTKSRVTVTNPDASRLPSQRGEFVLTPASPDPIRPKQIRKSDQLRPGPSVRVSGGSL